MTKWIQVRLGDLGTFSTSSVDKKHCASETLVSLINYMDVYRTNTIDSSIDLMEVTASKVEMAKSKVVLGDILFTPSSETPDDIGHSAVVDENLPNCLHSYHTVRFRPSDSNLLNLRFSAWFCNEQSVRKQFERKCAGSTRYTLSIPAFRAVETNIPLSTLVQGKIAAVLDTMDQTIKKTEALIKKYQQIKAGLMHDLFTRGIGADGKLRPPRELAPELYQETPIGWIPKEWSATKLSTVLSKIDSGWSPACMEVRPGIGEWGVLKVSAVTRGFYDCSESKTLPSNLRPIPALEVKNGDVILTRANGVAELVGKCVQVNDTQAKLMLSDKLLRLTPKAAMMRNDFLGQLMCLTSTKLQIDKSMNGSSGQRNISQADISGFVCPVPPMNEQDRISRKLLKQHYLIESEGKYLRKLTYLKFGLMQDLLTGKVQVNVDQSEIAHV